VRPTAKEVIRVRRQILLLLLVIFFLSMVGLFTVRNRWPGGGQPVWTVPGGDSQRGRQLIINYGCPACHVIAGVRQATGRVGPKLEDIGEQSYLAGVLPNMPDNLIQWIMSPQEISPGTAMPDLNVSEPDARDIATYLYQGQQGG
jgi:cytochrome c